MTSNNWLMRRDDDEKVGVRTRVQALIGDRGGGKLEQHFNDFLGQSTTDLIAAAVALVWRHPLAEVAGKTRTMPDEFIDAAGTGVTDAFRMYLRPLLGSGMPEAYRLRLNPVERAHRAED